MSTPSSQDHPSPHLREGANEEPDDHTASPAESERPEPHAVPPADGEPRGAGEEPRADGEPRGVEEEPRADGERGAGDEPRESVLSRAVLLLDAMGRLGVAGVSELSRRTGLAKTTTHRLASELVELGLVERAGDGYRLGSRLFELGSRVPGRRQFRDAALPFLEDLSRATDQTVHLAVLDGLDVLYVERLVGRRSSEVPSMVAARFPLHCTATGKCLLAFGPPELARRVLSAELEPLTPASITEPDLLREELAAVREAGVAHEVGEVAQDLRSVAAPVHELGGSVAGALSATGPIEDFDADGVAALVRMAAAGLSHRLGAD